MKKYSIYGFLASKEFRKKAGIFLISTAFIICWAITKFPPQLFGNNKDHFRAHVIKPIPESVEILDVEFDDLIINPDVRYFFRFHVNREDLNKIIAYRKLHLAEGEGGCSKSYGDPDWWNADQLNDTEVEVYLYSEGNTGSLYIYLCYHEASQTAYYEFFTY
jgi:hypothetical protein